MNGKRERRSSTGPGTGAIGAMRTRWELAVGAVAWLGGIIGPAITFDLALTRDGDVGLRFQAFFLVVSAVLFLLGWGLLGRLRPWMLGLIGAVAVAAFVGYTMMREDWSCAYYPELHEGRRLTTGTVILPAAREVLAQDPPADPSCRTLMEPFGGNAMWIWDPDEVKRHFLILFGLYALAWLSLALLVLGATRWSLKSGGKP